MKVNYNKFINHMKSVSFKWINGELNMSKSWWHKGSMRQTDRKEKESCKMKLRDINSNLRKPKRE